MTLRPGTHVDELISASITGDLTAAERAELDKHLATCESCRATLAAFSDERRLLAGLSHVQPPHDLAVRVQSGIEHGRFSAIPWWRRPGGVVAVGASLATVAAAILAVVVLSNLRPAPVGHATPSPSASALPTASVAASPIESVDATPEPAFALGPDELGYLSLNGASLEPGRLTFNNDATGASLDLGTVGGPPIAAELSPDGQWLAYITRKGESGANEVWAAHLTDGKVIALGCSLANAFTERLAWAPDTSELAFTLAAVDLGSSSGCPAPMTAIGSTDVWVFGTAPAEVSRFTNFGDAYAAAYTPVGFGSPGAGLLISHAAANPWTAAYNLNVDAIVSSDPIEDVFLPLISPDGNRAMFWSGTMARQAGSWQFTSGGMPQMSGDFRSAGPASPWIGTPLFTDLTPVGGEGFAYGSFGWAADLDRIAFWNGAWTGPPQSADGTYPSQQDLCIGTRGYLFDAAECHPGVAGEGSIVDVTLSPSGAIAVTVGLPSAGVGDPPSATLTVIPSCCGGEGDLIGGSVDPPPWNGPAVFGP
jgi:anti-sigma factor RsiW